MSFLNWLFFGNKSDEKRFLLGLDIGTEAVKAVIFKKGGNGSVKVFSGGVSYFDKYGVFYKNDFKDAVIKKAITQAIIGAKNGVKDSGLRDKIFNQKKWQAVLVLSPDILRARILSLTLQRPEPKKKISKKENRHIAKFFLDGAEKQVAAAVLKKQGIVREDIVFASENIIEKKIDGYEVTDLAGFRGKEVAAKVLKVFIFKKYFENIKKILNDLGLDVARLVHLADVLPNVFTAQNANCVFVDVGGRASQVIFISSGKIQKVSDLALGTVIFTEAIQEWLGFSEDSVRDWQERYARDILGFEDREKTKVLLTKGKEVWQEKIKGLGPFSNTLISGGGSFMPEIKTLFNKKTQFLPSDLPGLTGLGDNLNNSQYVPVLLAALGN